MRNLLHLQSMNPIIEPEAALKAASGLFSSTFFFKVMDGSQAACWNYSVTHQWFDKQYVEWKMN